MDLLRRVNRRSADRDRAAAAGPCARDGLARRLFQDGRAVGTILLWVACFMSFMEIYLLPPWLPSFLVWRRA